MTDSSPTRLADAEWIQLFDPDGVGPSMLFHRVAEGKVVKNRVHLDLFVSDVTESDKLRKPVVEIEVARLLDAGATHLRTEDDEEEGYYVVMQDPEGNEFCVA